MKFEFLIVFLFSLLKTERSVPDTSRRIRFKKQSGPKRHPYNEKLANLAA